MLAEMYTKWGYRKGYTVEMVEESKGEIAGIKSATLQIDGTLKIFVENLNKRGICVRIFEV